ncbi:MAG: hypothetical protein JWM27_3144 [Gemmatimonadetes bacterium]|nr:hypothetical protein [Gemmatimonadota bacterium]
MKKTALNVSELHVESFETLLAETQEHAAIGTRVGCPYTAYVTCYATPRQEDFRVTNLCC